MRIFIKVISVKYPLPHKLTSFLDISYTPSTVLVIESDYYIKELTGIFPGVKIYFASSDVYKLEDAIREYSDKIKYVPIAYNEERLPFKSRSVDIIMGDELFAENFNPQDIASGLGSFLKPTGYLLTSFSNLLFKPWVDKLLNDGRAEFIVRRGFTDDDFERLMVASFFKEIFFEPLFDSDKSLKEPPFYMARAYTSVVAVRNLKSMYSDSVRKELSKLLHRIEYGVNTAESVENLKRLMEKENIFEDYVSDFIDEACYNRDYVKRLVKWQ